MRALKSEIAACLDEDAKIALTPERRERMLGLLDTYESWSTLPESVRDSAIENADPQQLAEYVLSNEHFRSFYDKVLESDQVRQRVEKEKAQYAAEAVEAQAAAKQAQESLSHVRDELKRFDDELDLRRKRFEEEMSSHVKIAQEERDKLVEEVHALKERKDSLERGKESVRRQIDELVSSFSDEEVLMGRVLENAALKQVVSTVGGMSGSEHVGDGGSASTLLLPLSHCFPKKMGLMLGLCFRGLMTLSARRTAVIFPKTILPMCSSALLRATLQLLLVCPVPAKRL